jgi:Ni/Co efflux regulator RcnB
MLRTDLRLLNETMFVNIVVIKVVVVVVVVVVGTVSQVERDADESGQRRVDIHRGAKLSRQSLVAHHRHNSQRVFCTYKRSMLLLLPLKYQISAAIPKYKRHRRGAYG